MNIYFLLLRSVIFAQIWPFVLPDLCCMYAIFYTIISRFVFWPIQNSSSFKYFESWTFQGFFNLPSLRNTSVSNILFDAVCSMFSTFTLQSPHIRPSETLVIKWLFQIFQHRCLLSVITYDNKINLVFDERQSLQCMFPNS